MTREHPADEALIAYLADMDVGAESECVEAHLRQCERCVHTVLHLSDNTVLMSELGLQGGRPDASCPAVNGGEARRAAAWRFGSLYTLMPTAFAAGLLLAVAVRTWTSFGTPHVQVRGVDNSVQRTVAVTVAVMRSAPTPGAEVVETVPRETVVRVSAEIDGWCLVNRPPDRFGWLECASLR